MTAALLAAGAAIALPATAFAAAPVTPHTVTVDSPSSILAATPWETTGAVDQNGNPVALTDPAVANFVGWAYYDTDGTFRMFNLDDTPKMHGDWNIDPNAETRTITAKDDNDTTLFTRTVPLVTLTAEEFTYRVIPDANTPDVYYDIIHTPTDHPEPTAAPVPSATAPAPAATAPAPAATTPVDEASASPAVTTAPELAETGSAVPVVLIGVGAAAAAAGAGALVIRRRRAQS
jgi:LPXTG-motif cell wall-anchored protein